MLRQRQRCIRARVPTLRTCSHCNQYLLLLWPAQAKPLRWLPGSPRAHVAMLPNPLVCAAGASAPSLRHSLADPAVSPTCFPIQLPACFCDAACQLATPRGTRQKRARSAGTVFDAATLGPLRTRLKPVWLKTVFEHVADMTERRLHRDDPLSNSVCPRV